MNTTAVLMDFAIASVFILIGQLIRSKVKLVQRYFVPASMIAGFLALALGSQGLNVLPFSKAIGSYSGLLIIIVFASVGISGFSFSKKGFKAEIDRVGSYFSYKVLAQAIQFSLAPLFSILVISKIFPEISYGFGLCLAAGFSGGHGTAAAVGSVFAKLGFTDGTDIAMTCATVGILSGIFGGLAFINMGTKRGWTKYIKNFSFISGDLKTGLIQESHRPSIGKETISSMVLDPIAFHLLAFIFSFLLFILFKKTGVSNYVDNNIMSRLSGTATDYLVFFGIASIKISIIVKYAVPLFMLLVFGELIVIATLMYFGAAMNKGSWFERSIFVFGYSTGVFAIGFILLRIVDPENLSKTLNDTALTGPLTTPFELFAWSAGPIMLLNGQHWTFIGLYLLITVACVVVNKLFHWWWIKEPLDRPAVSDD